MGDSSMPDSRPPDTGVRDTGPSDTSVADTGVGDTSAPDTATPDTGVADTATPDTGVADTGVADTGVVDTGATDTGVADAGLCGSPPTGPPAMGLVRWYDAMDPGGDGSLPSDDDSLGTWVDLSPTLDNAGGSNTRWRASGIGAGRPSARTTGADGSRFEFANPDLRDFTIAVVFRTSDTRGGADWFTSPTIIGGDRDGAHNDGALVLSGGRVGWTRRASGHDFLTADGVSYATDTAHALVALRRDADGSVIARVDGAEVGRGSSTAGRVDRPNEWWLASHQNANNGRFANDYGEVLVYDRELGAADLAELELYLYCKWLE